MSSPNSLLTIAIRPARPGDAPHMVDLHRETLVNTYPGISPEAMQERYDALATRQERIQSMADSIASSGPTHALFVALNEAGQIVGYTWPQCVGAEGRARVGSLYVALPHLRRGVGAQLLHSNLAWHDNHHGQDVYLHTHPAQAGFYERFGFVLTGEAAEDRLAVELGVVALTDMVMMRPAGPPP